MLASWQLWQSLLRERFFRDRISGPLVFRPTGDSRLPIVCRRDNVLPPSPLAQPRQVAARIGVRKDLQPSVDRILLQEANPHEIYAYGVEDGRRWALHGGELLPHSANPR